MHSLSLTLLNSSYVPLILSTYQSFWNFIALQFCTLSQSDTHATSYKAVAENADAVGNHHPITQGVWGSGHLAVCEAT